MKQVLITTGATVTFQELMKSVLKKVFLNRLVEYKYDHMIVQYGKSEESIEFIRKLISELGNFNVKEYNNKDTGHNFEFLYDLKGILKVRCIQFDSLLIENFTSLSDLVISHAGTGSIIDTLRITQRDIRLIVMINEKLKDNHQSEIADAFKSLGVLESVGSNGDELLIAVDKIENDVVGEKCSWRRLPPSNGSIVERIVNEEMM